MKWIKTWSKINDNKLYLVLAQYQKRAGGIGFYNPQTLLGWQVKRLVPHGAYIATEFMPPTCLNECE